MWYPTVSDVTDIHERVASAKAQPSAVRDEALFDQLVVAPQRPGPEAQTASALGTKAAAILQHAITEEVFESTNEHIAFALASVFLQRNGFVLKASLADLRVISPKIREGMPRDEIADWVSERLTPEEEGPPGRRILAALNTLATIVERLEGTPGIGKDVDTLRRIGRMLCAGLESAFGPSERDRQRILEAYPALKEQWGEVFEPTTGDGSAEDPCVAKNDAPSLEEAPE